MEILKIVITALVTGTAVHFGNWIFRRKKTRIDDLDSQGKAELVWKSAHDVLDDAYLDAQKRIVKLTQQAVQFELKFIKLESLLAETTKERDEFKSQLERNRDNREPK